MISNIIFSTKLVFILSGRFAVNAKHAGKISYTTQKTKAPEKMWTSRSWWREIPGQNEVT